ncbi:FAD-dependent oxidoreductase [Desulfofundulus thermocisternus]|uniref:FAD-dependent oxidoreductase n=1 Tax=Desulfofundulus thermocisternus TaxID=42471 RepID=UPI0019ED0EF1|nr:FAD-dependent oxidoreductase [Desulfofundulus thermocisternus]MBE3586929.1 FAD-dependent oxidoreductase [Thermoanaerobacter sp.]MCS5695638.1 FAD-dependent oxidoreductase [Desulfofundulus thermocisternus]
MVRVVIAGGGWAGTGAAVAAAQAGAEVTVLERTDMLLGTGLVGGIMRNNGRFTATEEAIAMGLGDIFHVVDQCARHKNVDFPGHRHATLYDVAKIEPAIRHLLQKKGVQVRTRSRVKDVIMDGTRIQALVLDSGERVEGDVFIDTTGSAGPMPNCTKYGNGCAMCILRCPTFGGRVSIAARAGVKEFMGRKADGSIGAMSGSCKLHKESLDKKIVEQLDKEGVAVIPIPEHLRKGKDILAKKACQQYALAEFAENIILLDTGHAKLMSPTYPLDMLRQIPGFENARFEDPYAGGIGNSMRYMAMAPRDNALKVEGVDNLFCAGEKAGPMVGHTEAVVTGGLAGHNAVRYALGEELLVIPENLAIGDFIAHVNEKIKSGEGLGQKFTFSGSVYFQRMVEKGLYTTDVEAIRQRVEENGMARIFGRPLVQRQLVI